MSVVVVSNRVARARAGDAIPGGLAAALTSMVGRHGPVWVGLSSDSGGKRRAGSSSIGMNLVAKEIVAAQHWFSGVLGALSEVRRLPVHADLPRMVRC